MQRTIGVVLGGLVTYLILVLLDATSTDASAKYGMAVVVGGLVSWLWPWVIGFFLLRRAKERRDRKIAEEVDKQVAASKKG